MADKGEVVSKLVFMILMPIRERLQNTTNSPAGTAAVGYPALAGRSPISASRRVRYCGNCGATAAAESID